MPTTTSGPIRRLYRPLGGGAFPAFESEKYKLSGRTQKVRDVECVEIVLKDAPKNDAIPDYGYRLWCDPDRDFLPIREKQRYESGGYDVDYAYRQDDKGRWLLKGWTYTRLGQKGAVEYTLKATVKKLELDHKFAADAFAPKPPVGSHVTVYEDGQEKDAYLIRPDGE